MADYITIKLSCGYHTTAIITDKLYITGTNPITKTDITSFTEFDIDIRQSITDIKFGMYCTIIMTNVPNKIYIFGSNTHGSLGIGCTDDNFETKIPQPIEFPSAVTTINNFYYHNVVLLTNGDLYVWGDLVGQCSPVKINLPDVIEISCGSHFAMAITKDHQIWTWGTNHVGQLGLGDFNNRYIPTKINLLHVMSVSCGERFTCAVTIEKDIYEWGFINDEVYNLPHKLSLSNICSVKCGLFYAIALTYSGELYVWGSNWYGQLGLRSNYSYISRPTQVFLKESIKIIECGAAHNIIVVNNSDIYVWGHNSEGQLGVGHAKDVGLPQKLDFRF